MATTGETRQKRVTRDDVARLAGVSTAVVSYTLNAGPKNVSPATRAKVQEAVQILGYRPNALARALKRGSTEMLGLIVPDSTNPFLAEFAIAMETSARARGHALMVVNAPYEPSGEVTASILRLAARQVDGVLVANQVSSTDLAAIEASGVRAVFINQLDVVDGVRAIGVDLRAGARTAVTHLVEHGHRRIGFVGPGREENRQRGWRDALDAAGLPEGPRAAATFSFEGGYHAGRELMGATDRPTAVFASSDMQAIGLMRAAREAGLALPRDFAITSFDGSRDSEYTWPALTTMRQPVAQMAEDAVEALLAADTNATGYTAYSARLVVRQSCGCS